MANEVLHKVGTQLIFADHATDFTGGSAANSLELAGATDVQLDMTSVADTAARQSSQADFGATRARAYSVMAAVEMAATPTTGEVIEFYWSASPNSTAANGNAGYVGANDSDFTGTPATLAEAVKQLILIGTLVCSADATTTVQIQHIGNFSPPERYGHLVVKNESGAAFHSDAVETHIVFNPIVDEIQ